jgi:hypothetical protein
MKRLISIIFTVILAGCAVTPSNPSETYVATPSPIDQKIDSATIEDYILALPPFELHEESVKQFTVRVRSARLTEKQNLCKDRDYLFVRGDGSAPSKVFLLDRSQRMLTIRSINWEPGMSDDSVTMRRVAGGWQRGPRTEIKTGEQAAPSNGG